MGNAKSQFLAHEPDWADYVEQEWRSDNAKELDRLGGEGPQLQGEGRGVASPGGGVACGWPCMHARWVVTVEPGGTRCLTSAGPTCTGDGALNAGLSRPAVARGQSMTFKLQFLQVGGWAARCAVHAPCMPGWSRSSDAVAGGGAVAAIEAAA